MFKSLNDLLMLLMTFSCPCFGAFVQFVWIAWV